jgi:hypothetical protein
MTTLVTIPNVFQAQSGPIPLAQLDTNFSVVASSINNVNQYSTYLIDSSGAPNTITVTTGSLSFSYATGVRLLIKVSNTNTSTAVNINVNGLGNMPLINVDGANPTVSAITAGEIIDVIYNGTSFVQLNLNQQQPTYLLAVQLGSTTRGVATLSNDPVLVLTLPNAGTYTFTLNISQTNSSGGNANIIYNINYSGTFNSASNFGWSFSPLNSLISSTQAGSTVNLSSAVLSSGQQSGGSINGLLVATGPGILGFSWAGSAASQIVGLGVFTATKWA